jgi:hypothetical protein
MIMNRSDDGSISAVYKFIKSKNECLKISKLNLQSGSLSAECYPKPRDYKKIGFHLQLHGAKYGEIKQTIYFSNFKACMRAVDKISSRPTMGISGMECIDLAQDEGMPDDAIEGPDECDGCN